MARLRARLPERSGSAVEWVVGLDLSLRGAAACAVPLDFAEKFPDWRTIETARFGISLPRTATGLEKFRRQLEIARWVGQFVFAHQPVGIYVEAYAFAARGDQVHELAELRHAVNFEVYRALDGKRIPTSVPASQARKLLCGKVPTKRTSGVEVKDFVGEYLRRAGATFASHDEADAFVVANWGLSELGRPALIGASV